MDFGPTTGLFADPNTDHIWLATRCGRNPNFHSSNEGCTFKPDYNMVFKFMKYVDITRTPHATCEWWGYEAERTGRGLTGCGIDRSPAGDR